MTLTIYDILILIGIPTISASVFQMVYNTLSTKLKSEKSEARMIKKALQAILRDKLREHYHTYLENKFIPVEDKDNFNNLYQIYHSLGKNGVMDDMYKKVMELPTSKPRSRKQVTKNKENEE